MSLFLRITNKVCHHPSLSVNPIYPHLITFTIISSHKILTHQPLISLISHKTPLFYSVHRHVITLTITFSISKCLILSPYHTHHHFFTHVFLISHKTPSLHPTSSHSPTLHHPVFFTPIPQSSSSSPSPSLHHHFFFLMFLIRPPHFFLISLTIIIPNSSPPHHSHHRFILPPHHFIVTSLFRLITLTITSLFRFTTLTITSSSLHSSYSSSSSSLHSSALLLHRHFTLRPHHFIVASLFGPITSSPLLPFLKFLTLSPHNFLISHKSYTFREVSPSLFLMSFA